MASSLSKIDIINLALDYLGQASVSSIDPPTTELETTIERHYDPVRRACLREYLWNFAKKRIVLAVDVASPAFDFTDQFTLPNGCLRVISITDSEGLYDILDYDVEGRKLLIDANGQTSLRLRYIDDVEDVSLFDSLFVQYFALKLAVKLAYKQSLKKSLVTQLSNLIAIEELKAISIDGQERPPVVVRRRSTYLNAHRGYNFRNDYRYEP